MFDRNEATKERISSYMAALEQERKGYVARAAAVKAGHSDRLDEAQLELRIRDVDAELKRVKALKPKGEKDDAAKDGGE